MGRKESKQTNKHVNSGIKGQFYKGGSQNMFFYGELLTDNK